MDLFRRSFFLPTRPVSHVWCEDMMHYFNATAVQYQVRHSLTRSLAGSLAHDSMRIASFS